MKWIPMINSIVVNGGKNAHDSYLSDTHLLKLDSLTWVELKIYG